MPGIAKEDDAKLTVLFEEALKIQEQFKATENDPVKIIALYKKYYKKYKEHQPKSKDIAIRALTKIRNNELIKSPLTNEEITELHRHLGIIFTEDGDILEINEKAPILKYVKNILIKSLQKILLNVSKESQRALKKLEQGRGITIAEINLLHKELGIIFNSDGTISKINNHGLRLISRDPILNPLLGAQQENQPRLTGALSRMQNNELTHTPLTNIEITLLHRNLGIMFNDRGDILDISSEVISYMQNLLTELTNNYGLYTAFKLQSKKPFPSQKELTNILDALKNSNKSHTSIVALLKPITATILQNQIIPPGEIVKQLAIPDPIFNLFKKAKLPPDKIFNDCKYPDPAIPELLASLEQLLTTPPPKKNEQKINNTFVDLYKYLGIKCQYTTPASPIALQKIKFNSPVLSADPEYKKYNLHFGSKDTLYATMTYNIPANRKYLKILGRGALGKVSRAIIYKKTAAKEIIHEYTDNLEEVAVKTTIIDSEATLVATTKEIQTLDSLQQKRTAKRGLDKRKRMTVQVVQDLAQGSPLNQANSSKLDFTQKIALMRLIALQLKHIHDQDTRHNDLKGENIIVNYSKLSTITDPKEIPTDNPSKSEFARIIDYGSIEKINPQKPPKYNESPLGTALYIATEICAGYAAQGQKPPANSKDYLKSDIYSLGKVLIHDANLHNLGIAYRMTDSLYKNRPTIDEFIQALGIYQQNATQIAQQEEIIANTQNLSEKVQAIKRLFDEQDICSQEYYKTLLQVLEKGTKEDLQTMQRLTIFKHLFKVDSLALQQKIYQQRPEIQFENKMLELLQHAAKNSNHEFALILINHLYEQVIDATEAQCEIRNITSVLETDKDTYAFICNVIKEYQEQHPELQTLLKQNTKLSSSTTSEKLSDIDTDSSVGGYSSESSSSPNSRPPSRRSSRSR